LIDGETNFNKFFQNHFSKKLKLQKFWSLTPGAKLSKMSLKFKIFKKNFKKTRFLLKKFLIGGETNFIAFLGVYFQKKNAHLILVITSWGEVVKIEFEIQNFQDNFKKIRFLLKKNFIRRRH
jgi:hypothetical protein